MINIIFNFNIVLGGGDYLQNNLMRLSSCIALSFFILFLFLMAYNLDIQRHIDADLEEHAIYTRVDAVSDTAIKEKSDESIDEIVEVLTEDQKIKKVKTYTSAISIPRIKVLAYVNDGVGKSALDFGFGRYTNSAELGTVGNTVVAGHSSNIYNCLLNGLEKKIQYMDKITVWNKNGKKLNYYVMNTKVVEPDDFSIFDAPGFGKWLTIFTCTDNGARRFVVSAVCMDKSQIASIKNAPELSKLTDLESEITCYSMERISMELERGSYFDISKN